MCLRLDLLLVWLVLLCFEGEACNQSLDERGFPPRGLQPGFFQHRAELLHRFPFQRGGVDRLRSARLILSLRHLVDGVGLALFLCCLPFFEWCSIRVVR